MSLENHNYEYLSLERREDLAKQIESDFLWYLKIAEIQDFLKDEKEKNPSENQEKLKKELVWLLEELLAKDAVALASSGPDCDRERKIIDTIILHHTSGSPEIVNLPPEKYLSYVNALQLLRLYVPVHSNSKDPEEFHQPLWSNHFYKNKPTFIAYHWLIWPNGEGRQILQDSQIGWQAGDWEANCRSLAVCFVANLENSEPSPEALQTAAQIIQDYQKKYPISQILGHSEINTKTTCPGHNFSGPRGWKNKLFLNN